MLRIICLTAIVICSCCTKTVEDGATAENDEESKKGKRVRSGEMTVVERTKEILAEINGWGYLARGASDPGAVVDSTVVNEEVRFLIENSSVSLPMILEWLDKGYTKGRIPLTVFFIVFTECGDPKAIPYLIDYLRNLPESEKGGAGLPTHPFRHAINAIEALTGIDFTPSSFGDLFGRRFEVADKAERWYVEYLQKEPPDEREKAVRAALRRLTTRTFWFDILHTKKELSREERRKLLLKKKEVKLLIKESDVSLPLLYERIGKRKGPLNIYFLILGETRKAESVPYLVEYLKGLPDEERMMDIDSEWEKFGAALEALRKITKIDIPPDKGVKELYRDRDEIITEAVRWHNEHSPGD